jgi:hypothetical protein
MEQQETIPSPNTTHALLPMIFLFDNVIAWYFGVFFLAVDQ